MPSETEAPKHHYIDKGIEGFDKRIPQGNSCFAVSASSSEDEKAQNGNIVICLDGCVA